ncbi:hypothetical protein HPB49_024997 [Dermacentor silvarum]|uniref:Uncharacterized protein n=8 Tax=Dermacentor silvarum TaxID=543639 RepID=A0ACB8CYR1_DERSI|nr:hypothetical protein HPB49_006763 [Dermacentor silvarum]KAH7954036.1 hypothetical protein HPB49_015012 [Dermacentor silvarum]KAH7954192.1 hypothetical protein HPB49_016399 [Dermacentor silvarum]KAH7954241.1 hypothetical protein HPB49_016804 [Dermacentor silvarum]KAH7954882.1 hypothetical protein HPB49_022553 [Dermacentor silvarum]
MPLIIRFTRSDDRFARQNRFGPPPEFPLASSCPGIVHHLSGANVCALAPPRRRVSAWDGPLLRPLSDPCAVRDRNAARERAFTFHCAIGASAGELPRSQRLLAGQPAATGPTRTAGDDKLAQRVLRSVSGGRHRSGLPTTGRSPWGLDGVTNLSYTARYNSREPSPKGRAGHLHSRTQSRTFPIDPRPSRRSTGGGKCAPRRPRLRASSRNSPPKGAVYPTPPAPRSSGD